MEESCRFRKIRVNRVMKGEILEKTHKPCLRSVVRLLTMQKGEIERESESTRVNKQKHMSPTLVGGKLQSKIFLIYFFNKFY